MEIGASYIRDVTVCLINVDPRVFANHGTLKVREQQEQYLHLQHRLQLLQLWTFLLYFWVRVVVNFRQQEPSCVEDLL